MITLKACFTIVVLAATTVALNSCCKLACVGKEIFISFENYKRSEINTIFFLGYEPNTNFSTRRDSVAYIITNVAGDTSKATHVHNIFADNDWIVKVPSVAKEFRFSNYEIATAKCGCGNKKYQMVKSYEVNGANETAEVYKLPR